MIKNNISKSKADGPTGSVDSQLGSL